MAGDDRRAEADLSRTESPPIAPRDIVAAESEGRGERRLRHARRASLYGWAALLAVVLVLLVVLVAENTHRVRVGWIFGYSRVSLVYLVLVAALLGWVVGIVTSIVFRRRTRRTRSG